MKQHKWHKEIKAWADGAEIEEKIGETWHQVLAPTWNKDRKFRIKSQFKKSQYLYVYFNAEMVSVYKEPLDGWDGVLLGKIKLEVDDD